MVHIEGTNLVEDYMKTIEGSVTWNEYREILQGTNPLRESMERSDGNDSVEDYMITVARNAYWYEYREIKQGTVTFEEEYVETIEVIELFGKAYGLRLATETIELYKRYILEFFWYVEKPFDEIVPKDIRQWLLTLTERGMSTSTRNVQLAGVRLFYKYLLEEERIEKNPAERMSLSKVEEKLPQYLLPTQLKELRTLITDQKERAIVEVLYSTGIRIGELISINQQDINWSERSIHIRKGKRKKERIVLFTRDCEEHLQSYLGTRQDKLPALFLHIDTPIQKGNIQYLFEPYALKLNVRLTPHTLRHTFAAHLAMKKMPIECIQQLLGHDNLRQTMYYAKLFDHAKKELYDEWM